MAAPDRCFASSILSIKHFKDRITTIALADGSHLKQGKIPIVIIGYSFVFVSFSKQGMGLNVFLQNI